MSNPLVDIPDGDLVDWVIGWRGKITRDVGTDYVRAENSERAKREYEREHPLREVTNIHQSKTPTTSDAE